MATNLPAKVIDDSAAGTVLFFERYGEVPMEFSSNDVNMTLAFFKSAGFEEDAAQTCTMTLLRQAKIDETPIAQLLDTIKVFDANQLSQLVGEILNNNRTPTSMLGFRVADVKPNQTRQIVA